MALFGGNFTTPAVEHERESSQIAAAYFVQKKKMHRGGGSLVRLPD
jgi:hypothetical protein